MNLGKLVENNSSKTTRRKQLVENTRRKTRRKATRRKFSGGKLVARTENNLRQIHYGTRKLRTPVEFLKTERKI